MTEGTRYSGRAIYQNYLYVSISQHVGDNEPNMCFNATHVQVPFASRYTLLSYRRIIVIPLIAQHSSRSVIYDSSD